MSKTAKRRRRLHWRKLVRRGNAQLQLFNQERSQSMANQQSNTTLGAALASAGVVTAGQPTPAEQRTQREFQRADFREFAAAATAMGITPGQLAQRIGYSASAASDWKTRNECPRVAVVAVTELLARREAEAKLAMQATAPRVLALWVYPDGFTVAVPLDTGATIELNRETYVKLPAPPARS